MVSVLLFVDLLLFACGLADAAGCHGVPVVARRSLQCRQEAVLRGEANGSAGTDRASDVTTYRWT